MAKQEVAGRLPAERPATQSRAQVAQRQRPTFPWGKVGFYAGVVAVIVFALGPFYWTINTSLKTGLELNQSPPTFIPLHPGVDNYLSDIINSSFFGQDLLNSAIIAGCTTILCIGFGSLCAYAISRYRFSGRALILALVLALQMFPVIALIGPLYLFFTNVNLYNTYAALIIPDVVFTLPLTVWFLVSFFNDLPKDLEESAAIDGCSRLQAFYKIVLPLTAPGVFTAAILSFIWSWNEFLFALTLTSDAKAQPVTVAITLFGGEHSIPWGEIAAAAVIVTIPLVIMVLIFQKRIVSGLTAGAVKG